MTKRHEKTTSTAAAFSGDAANMPARAAKAVQSEKRAAFTAFHLRSA